MKSGIQAVGAICVMLLLAAGAGAEPGAAPGTEEFGLTPRQLVQSIEKVEPSIARCMREQGFEYVASDYRTVRRGMSADKILPGMSEEEFISKYGFGLSTVYTGEPPQLTTGYSPARVGLGEENVGIFKNLSPVDQVAYNRALLGEHAEATLAVGLETEDFSRTGGCTRQAIEEVFEPEQLKATYYNPQGGWKTPVVLLTTYTHFIPSELHGFADALSTGQDGNRRDRDPTAAKATRPRRARTSRRHALRW